MTIFCYNGNMSILTEAVASDLVLLLYNTFSMCPFLTGLFWVLVAGGICFCWCGSVSRFSVWGENMSFSQALWVVLFFQSCAFDVFYTGRHRHTCFISPLCLTVLGSALRSCLKPPQRPITPYVNCANEKRHRVFGVCARVVCSHTAVKAEKKWHWWSDCRRQKGEERSFVLAALSALWDWLLIERSPTLSLINLSPPHFH